jgi:hypothetical protein
MGKPGKRGYNPGAVAEYGGESANSISINEIAVKLGPLEKPFTRADLHKRFY